MEITIIDILFYTIGLISGFGLSYLFYSLIGNKIGKKWIQCGNCKKRFTAMIFYNKHKCKMDVE